MTRTESTSPITFKADEAFARSLDETDPLREQRDRFLIPKRTDGEPVIYFCGNSLGLQPRTVRLIVEQELDDWATLAVDAHLKGTRPWFSYHELFADSAARIVGAKPPPQIISRITLMRMIMRLRSAKPASPITGSPAGG